ncbi:MAG TPA: HAD family phosphatase [Polyangiaceae bacterium]|jgi:HAD superfamily hydrolase (TIGR01509 family)
MSAWPAAGFTRIDATGVAIDMDGVLLDSEEIHAAAYRTVLAVHGIDDFVYREHAGMRTDLVFERVFAARGRPLSAADLSVCVAEKRALAAASLEARTPLVDGCVPVVRQLATRRPLFLASSASGGAVDRFFRASGLRDAFVGSLCGDDVPDAKPNPAIYVRAFAALGCSPHDGVVIEDAVAGVQAGRSAGATVIGLGDYVRAGALRDAGCAVVISRLADLTDLL